MGYSRLMLTLLHQDLWAIDMVNHHPKMFLVHPNHGTRGQQWLHWQLHLT